VNDKQKKIAKDLLALAYEVKELTPYNKRLPASIMAAQAIHETGWLVSIPEDNSNEIKGRKSFNILGIKAIPGKYEGTNGYVTCGTHEYNVECDLYAFVPKANFRAYYSYKECFIDYVEVIHNSMINMKVLGVTLPIKVKRYRNAIASRLNPYDYLLELWRAGYASDKPYVNKVWNLAVQCKFVKKGE